MRHLAALVVVLAIITLLAAQVGIAGNSDAAHACQQGGYASLQGSDGTLFKNAGECTAFAARGGTIGGITAACSFISGTSGCITYNDVTIHQIDPSNLQPLGTNTYTFTGSITFSPICSGCGTPTASGSGTFAFAGTPSLSGTWVVTGPTSPIPSSFQDASGGTTCAAATTRQVTVDVTLKDDATNATVAGGWIETRLVNGVATPTSNFVEAFFVGLGGGFYYTSDTSRVTIAC